MRKVTFQYQTTAGTARRAALPSQPRPWPSAKREGSAAASAAAAAAASSLVIAVLNLQAS